LFKYNTTAPSFINTFQNCSKLVMSPWLFYDESGAVTKTTRFSGQTVSFTNFFRVSASTAASAGTAPDLWNAHGTLTGTNAFTGHNDSSLTNWDGIPEGWGGPTVSSSSSEVMTSSSTEAMPSSSSTT